MATPIEQLEAMRKVPENWDGYGAAAPRGDVIDAAIRFLSQILGTGAAPQPFVSPTRTGGVLVEWELGAHELEVEFSSPDKASFLYMNAETGETVTGRLALHATNGQQPFAVKALLNAMPLAAVS